MNVYECTTRTVHTVKNTTIYKTIDKVAPLPSGWQFTQNITGGYYSNPNSRKTSQERPTNVGRSFA